MIYRLCIFAYLWVTFCVRNWNFCSYFQFCSFVLVLLYLFASSLRVVDCASPKLIMSRGFHTGDPTIKWKKRKEYGNHMKKMLLKFFDFVFALIFCVFIFFVRFERFCTIVDFFLYLYACIYVKYNLQSINVIFCYFFFLVFILAGRWTSTSTREW